MEVENKTLFEQLLLDLIHIIEEIHAGIVHWDKFHILVDLQINNKKNAKYEK